MSKSVKPKDPNHSPVRLADGRTGVVLIPGLDACLVQTTDGEKLWCITDWDYQRRLQKIEKGIAGDELVADLTPIPHSSKTNQKNKVNSLYHAWLPDHIRTTRILPEPPIAPSAPSPDERTL